MDKCFLCGASGIGIQFHKGIHKEFGIIDICDKCYLKDRIPLIEKKQIDWAEIDKKLTVRERLSNMAKINSTKIETPVKKLIIPEDIQLKDLIEKNFRKKIEPEKRQYDDLISNFHWAVMMKRRSKRISRNELAEAIHEPEIIIKNLEKGILPENYILLIKKLENYFNFNLSKIKKRNRISPEEIINESKFATGIKLSDLRGKESLEKEIEQKVLDEIVEEESKHNSLDEDSLKEDVLELEELNLDKIKEVIGEPIIEKQRREENTSRKKEKLDEKDIKKIVWGKN